jgi:hypothetical protein
VEYDLDAAGKEQEVVSCTVTATDKGGHTVTTQLSITVNEVNDNPPVLNQGSYSYFVSQCTSVGSAIGQATTTDKDVKQEHKDVTFTLTSGAGFLVGNDGRIHVGQDLCNVPVGTKYDLTLTAANADGKSDTAPVTIVITGMCFCLKVWLQHDLFLNQSGTFSESNRFTEENDTLNIVNWS